jgi:hypothetical protein
VPRDDNDKNPLLMGLNIRITEVYVKQKRGMKTESLEIGIALYSRRLKNKNLHFDSKDVKKFLSSIGDGTFERPESPFLLPFNTPQ